MAASEHFGYTFMDSLDDQHATPPSRVRTRDAAVLYVVATPLGNLNDITLRALEVLGKVDAIAAEDTRHTRQLLTHHGIQTRLLAVHEHNEQAAAEGLVALLAQGQSLALVSDAGTPAVSDPGARVVATVQAAGFAVVPVPGPSALIAALSASGLAERRFFFHGFLAPKRAARQRELEALRGIAAALVFYEAPHRVSECVDDLLAVLGGRRELVVARELTKLHEEIARMPLAQAPTWFAANSDHCRGEFVLLVGAEPQKATMSLEAESLLKRLLQDLPVSKSAKIVADVFDLPKKQVYDHALGLAGRDA